MRFISCPECGAKMDSAFPNCIFCRFAEWFAECDLQSPGNRILFVLQSIQPETNQQKSINIHGKMGWLLDEGELK